MPRWPFRRQADADKDQEHEGVAARPEASESRTAEHGTVPSVTSAPDVVISPERRRIRTDELRRRRDALLYEIERGEDARQPDNPWAARIALLTESLDTIATDRAALDHEPAAPTWPVPSLPVRDIDVQTAEPLSVRFTVGAETFRFAEQQDWDNRGGIVVRGDLEPTSGTVGAVMPEELPPDIRQAFTASVAAALLAFAVRLRDDALAGEAHHSVNILRDIVTDDDEAGGWRDLHGANPVRLDRAYRRQQLRAQEDRLIADRNAERDEQRTLTDRLPVARRRLEQVEADLARLGG